MELKNKLSKDEWKSLLKANRFFDNFDNNEIDQIIQFCKLLYFPMHEYIIKEKEEGLSFYAIAKGHANVIRKDRLPGERKLMSIYEGECFGEMAVITKKPRTNSIIAGSNCYVVKIDTSTMESFDAGFQLKLYRQFARSLVERLVKADHFL